LDEAKSFYTVEKKLRVDKTLILLLGDLIVKAEDELKRMNKTRLLLTDADAILAKVKRAEEEKYVC